MAGSARNARTAIFGLVVDDARRAVPGRSDGGTARPGRTARRRGPGRLLLWIAAARHAASGRRVAARLADRAFLAAARGRRSATGATASVPRPPGPALAAAAGFALAALAVLPVVDRPRHPAHRDRPDACCSTARCWSGSGLGGTPDAARAGPDRRPRGDARRRRGGPGGRAPARTASDGFDARADRPGRPVEPRRRRPPDRPPMSLLVYLVVAFGSRRAGHRRAARVTGRRPSSGSSASPPRSSPRSPSIRRRSSVIGGGGHGDHGVPAPVPRARSLVGLGLAVAGLAAGHARDAPAVTLAILGAPALTLGLVERGRRCSPPRPAACSACCSRSSRAATGPARRSASARPGRWSSRARWRSRPRPGSGAT